MGDEIAVYTLNESTLPYPYAVFGVPVIWEHAGVVPLVQAVLNRALRIAEGVSDGFTLRINATVPDTCGVAIDVPLNVA